MNEFEIIEHFFKQAHPTSKGNLALGIGDDAAIINVPEDSELLLSMDTLVTGVHFFNDTNPEEIAHKSLAVNLSDIAAMGGLPRWICLSLTLPEKNIEWLEKFSSRFNQLAAEYALTLVGGDMTRGPLSITAQIHGVVPKGKSLRRSGANAGDKVYVTGQLGAAAYALRYLKDNGAFDKPTKIELQRLNQPEPRIKTGIELRDVATSCIDISDGLLADLGHILKSSNVGAEIKLSSIPFSDSLKSIDRETAIEIALTGGDDYELCFTLPDGMPETIIEELESICPITCIGSINSHCEELNLIDNNGELYEIKSEAYRHF